MRVDIKRNTLDRSATTDGATNDSSSHSKALRGHIVFGILEYRYSLPTLAMNLSDKPLFQVIHAGLGVRIR